ncbi:MAG: apolipoprotein N-acyltransferase, partial [Alphaproteobacteria bacterium]
LPVGVARLRRAVAGLTGWRRRGAAALLGAAMTLALPPLYILPAMALAISGLLWLSEGEAAGATARRRLASGFALGWWFGLGYFAFGLYWINSALLVDGWRFAWLIPLSVAGIGGGLALFSAIAVAAACLARPGWPRLLALAGGWTLLEVARGHLFTGFPWNLAGHALVFSDLLVQGASLSGVYGLSLAVVLWAGGASLLDRPIRSGALLLLVGLPLAMAAYGFARLERSYAPTDGLMPVMVRLVQPAVPQREKWDPTLRFAHLDRLVDLTAAPPRDSDQAPQVVIWPEAATAFDLAGDAALRRAIAGILPAGGVLIAGTLRQELGQDRGQDSGRVFNAIIAVDSDGAVRATYDKHHLVPFGEYVPFADAPGVAALALGRGSLSAGAGRRTLRVGHIPAFGPLVCYEAIFPGQVTARGTRPDWLLNLTNDAWYGETAGPHQHFAAVRLRAVEEGLPLVRVANTGISAVVDSWGRLQAVIPLGVGPAFVDAPLPRALPATVFARVGLAGPLSLAGLVLLAGWGLSGRGVSGRDGPVGAGPGARS